METIHVTFDELTTMASEQIGSGPGLQVLTPATSSSGLVPNSIPQQPFQVASTPRAIDLADSPVSTSIDQDAPSTSIPSTQEQELLGSRKVSVTSMILLDSSLNNIWKLNRLVKEKPMESP
ncbi:hypothetical protein Tco_1333692 [Tanacetum coccineum]